MGGWVGKKIAEMTGAGAVAKEVIDATATKVLGDAFDSWNVE
jgi:hypothetical protein